MSHYLEPERERALVTEGPAVGPVAASRQGLIAFSRIYQGILDSI
jgi:hypothetical protein